jgi:secondary thiamine-phosphate synthase enzyme
MIWQKEITLAPFRRGYHLITRQIVDHLPDLPDAGLLNLMIKHTSAGLTVNENADPTVRHDFERFMNSLVPESYSGFLHTDEGPDDMPAHVKASLLGQSLTIPITGGKLNLGIWQGIYLCEFRNTGGQRKIVLTVYS